MNHNTKTKLCTVEDCMNQIHSKGLCRKHYRLKNISYCTVNDCSNVLYARGYCSKHYRTHYVTTVCGYKNCEKHTYMSGYCLKHYRRYKKHGDPSVVKSKKVTGVCKEDNCESDIYSLGYCTKHYQRFKRFGDASSSNLTLIVDHDGRCLVKGCHDEFFAKNMCEKHYKRKYKRKYLQTERGREVSRKSCQKRRAIKRKSPFNDFSLDEWEECLSYFNHECAYCGKAVKVLDQEHVTPISKGGSNTKTNIVPSCGSCNSSKGNKTIFEWYGDKKDFSLKRKKKILKYLGYKVSENKIQTQLF